MTVTTDNSIPSGPWPPYQDQTIRDYAHAIGVVAIQFAELEAAVQMFLGRYLNLRLDVGFAIVGTLGNVTLTETLLTILERGERNNSKLLESCRAGIVAFGVLRDSRNILVHARLTSLPLTGDINVAGLDTIRLYKIRELYT